MFNSYNIMPIESLIKIIENKQKFLSKYQYMWGLGHPINVDHTIKKY